MAEQFVGRVDVLDDAGRVVFSFDPQQRKVVLGSDFPDVTVVEDGHQGIVLNSKEGAIFILNKLGAPSLSFQSSVAALTVGSVPLGGFFTPLPVGAKNFLHVLDSAGRVAFQLNAQNANLIVGSQGNAGDVLVQDGAGRRVLEVDGNGANLIVGADGNSGDIALRDDNGQTTIHLDAGRGDIHLLGADCAEDFDIGESREPDPGTVMAIGEESKLHQCAAAYDKKVVGVVSGAGEHKPGIVLNSRQPRRGKVPLALMGKVYCKVDAQYAPIEVGDMLTTSPTLGHAMKADDPSRAFGATIGKALRSLEAGTGLIPALIAMR